MPWAIVATEVFEEWLASLDTGTIMAIRQATTVLAQEGPRLGRPVVDTVNDSQYPNMKELRVQRAGRPLRIFFAFDPTRTGILLLGGDKTGDDRFYKRMIREADALYAAHLITLEGS